MSRALLRRIAVSALSVLLVASLTGCWNPFAPDPGDDPPPPVQVQYKLRTSPQNVIHNLNTSYVYMNAAEYLDCLADTFIFYLNPDDITEDPELPVSWGKHTEETIHNNMFGEGTDVEGIALIFTHRLDEWFPNDPGDPLDDEYIYIEDIDLRVQLPPDLTLHAEAPAEFLFKVDPNETGPSGEVLWEISKQWDRSTGPPRRGDGAADGERVSLTHIKAAFRE